MKTTSFFACAGLLLATLGCDADGDHAGAPEPDNTEVNERDADGTTMVPLDQSNDQDDIDLVAKIRAEVLEIEDLSTNGRNVKIITNDGKVMLRGPVDSAAERDVIAQVANAAAGEANVTNQLEVKTD